MLAAVLLLPSFLTWADVDPTDRPFDVGPAAALAAHHVRAAQAGGVPPSDDARVALEATLDRALVAHYGPWVGAWNWAPTEPGGGGPVRGWCCARDSVLPDGDRDPQATIDRVVGAVVDLRRFLEDLAARFSELHVATADLPLERGLEHAAAALLPLILERTGAEDAWYQTFTRVLGWYVESIGGDDRASAAIAAVVRGRFESWTAPDRATSAATCAAVGVEVVRALADPPVHDALPMWRKLRGVAFAGLAARGPYPLLADDAHRRFIQGPERTRDPERAGRMLTALEACRASAARGERLTFARLAAWQALVLGEDEVGFRAAPAYARGGGVYYQLGDRTRSDFEAALAEAEGPGPVAVRAARAYLDVCFFHPFDDGNGRAARLALDHVLTRAGLGLHAAEPLFVIARAADDRRGAACLALAIEHLLGRRA